MNEMQRSFVPTKDNMINYVHTVNHEIALTQDSFGNWKYSEAVIIQLRHIGVTQVQELNKDTTVLVPKDVYFSPPGLTIVVNDKIDSKRVHSIEAIIDVFGATQYNKIRCDLT